MGLPRRGCWAKAQLGWLSISREGCALYLPTTFEPSRQQPLAAAYLSLLVEKPSSSLKTALRGTRGSSKKLVCVQKQTVELDISSMIVLRETRESDFGLD